MSRTIYPRTLARWGTTSPSMVEVSETPELEEKTSLLIVMMGFRPSLKEIFFLPLNLVEERPASEEGVFTLQKKRMPRTSCLAKGVLRDHFRTIAG